MKSRPYKFGTKMFRYDYDRCVVEWISKANAEMRADDEEWMAKYGRPLWGIDEKGYTVIDAVGLRPENWKNVESRKEYLAEWCGDIAEECAYEAAYFEKYELPMYL